MKRLDQEQLLKEILAEDDAFRRDSLDRGLACLRQQRRKRQWMRAACLALLPGLVAAGIFLIQPRLARPVVSADHSTGAPTPPQPSPDTVKLINDDELLSLFPGQAVALIGKPGQQRLVFLDQQADSDSNAPF
jgi:hypothetical protein